MKRKLAPEALYHSDTYDSHISPGCMSLIAFDRTREKIRRPDVEARGLALLKEIEGQRAQGKRG